MGGLALGTACILGSHMEMVIPPDQNMVKVKGWNHHLLAPSVGLELLLLPWVSLTESAHHNTTYHSN